MTLKLVKEIQNWNGQIGFHGMFQSGMVGICQMLHGVSVGILTEMEFFFWEGCVFWIYLGGIVGPCW